MQACMHLYGEVIALTSLCECQSTSPPACNSLNRLTFLAGAQRIQVKW